jgi:hypothetical protein
MNLSIQEFEEMTPYELVLYSEAKVEAINAERQEQLTLVWLGEYYHRLKKLPPLKEELKKYMNQESHTQMTDEQMLQMVERLNKQFGGKVKERGEDNGT